MAVDNFVKIDFDDMFWNINVRECPSDKIPAGKEKGIRLIWGWDAKDSIDICDEFKGQNQYVDTTVSMAKMLIFELSELINKIENK